MTDGELKLKNIYRFKAQDAEVGTVFLYNDVLRATISVAGRDSYKVLQMIPTNDDAQFSIYGSIQTVVSTSNRNIAVAYNNNLRDEARFPVMLFDENGGIRARYHDEWALFCSDVNIDREESVPDGT